MTQPFREIFSDYFLMKGTLSYPHCETYNKSLTYNSVRTWVEWFF